jgi:hypothetical protein
MKAAAFVLGLLGGLGALALCARYGYEYPDFRIWLAFVGLGVGGIVALVGSALVWTNLLASRVVLTVALVTLAASATYAALIPGVLLLIGTGLAFGAKRQTSPSLAS